GPGVNQEIFKPLGIKKELRQKFGLGQDWNIAFTVMRNQKRKLYPDLFDMFAGYLKYCVNKNMVDLAEKTYLYCNVSHPDVGYDIGKHIMRTGLTHKVLINYYCDSCKNFYPSFYSGEVMPCRFCRKPTAHPPNTHS